MIEIVESVTGKTDILGIIGNPIEHSISPQIHNTVSKCMGLDLIYVPFKVEKEDVKNLLKGFKSANIVGFNVTVPYKSFVMEFLDHVTEEALLMGAVNTVKNIRGKLHGYNTDGEGFSRSFKKEAGTGFEGKRVVIIGAGGAARAIGVKVAMEGADEIAIVNRTLSRAEELASVINGIRSVAMCCELEKFKKQGGFRGRDIIINTTSAGMLPHIDCNPIGDWTDFSENQIVYDAIYNPPKTKLLVTAENKRCRIVNGFGMLLYQAVGAYEIWMEKMVPEKLIAEIYDSFSNYLKYI